jgi:hypothetical protein
MGRPLKIKQSTTKDIGFNAWGVLTAPVYPATFNSTQFAGVVGGQGNGGGVATSGYPVVKCRVYITGQAEADGWIVRQKGVRKYLVASVTSINAVDLVAGQSYYITSVGTTNWSSCGGAANAAVGDVFTATGAGAGNGTANLVGVCVLANQAESSLTAGNMNISYSNDGDSSEVLISKLTNKYAYDFTGGEVGGATGGWAQSAVQQNVRYAANFFTDEGTEIKSGTTGQANTATQQNLLNLVIVENYTS